MLINSLAPTHTPTLQPQRAPLRDAIWERVEILLLNHKFLYSLVFSNYTLFRFSLFHRARQLQSRRTQWWSNLT